MDQLVCDMMKNFRKDFKGIGGQKKVCLLQSKNEYRSKFEANYAQTKNSKFDKVC